MDRTLTYFFVFVAFLLTAVPAAFSQEVADRIWSGGTIITMDANTTNAEAVAVKDGKILAVGKRNEVMTYAGPDTELVDLAGRTIVPGFIDAHSHIVQQSLKYSTVNLDPYPIGDVKTIADLQKKLAERVANDGKGPGEWVFGWGYDDTGLKEQRHPNRKDLDAVSADRPIALMHISNHLIAANSLALKLAGITDKSKDPEGGVYRREADGVTPNGVLEETAMFTLLAKVPAPTADRAMEMLGIGVRKYAEAGITTAQDGATTPGMARLLQSAEDAGLLPIDIVAFMIYKGADETTVDKVAAQIKQRDRFRLGGMKLAVDGSIQGYTAYLSEPYHVSPPSQAAVTPEANTADAGADLVLGKGYDPLPPASFPAIKVKGGYRGYASMTVEDVSRWVKLADAAGVQILVHTNGDAATDILIEAIRRVRGDKARPDLRTVIIHAQTMREDQLDLAAKSGLVPSFFPIHVPFWGDRHKTLFLGPERAARIDPARSALQRGMRFTLHHDAPVAGIDMLAVMSAAVNRRTTGGDVLGEDQKILPADALRAVTIDAAWQYFEEDRKGSIEPGKLADMVILSDNPLEVDPKTIGDIQVLETIKEGVSIYTQKS